MTRGVVAAAYEIVQRDVKVVCEGDEGIKSRFGITVFPILIISFSYTSSFCGVPLCSFLGLSNRTQMFFKNNHDNIPQKFIEKELTRRNLRDIIML